jgi:hypothetical protein
MTYKLDGKEYGVEWDFNQTASKNTFDFIEDPQDKWLAYSGNDLYAYNAKLGKWLALIRHKHQG